MPSFITESTLYKILDNVFIKPYFNSKLKIKLGNFCKYFKESFIYIWFLKYINKNPYFLNSFVYKSFRKFILLIDKIMDILHNFFKRLLIGSKIYNEAKNIKETGVDKKLLISAMIISALDAGYIIGGVIFNTINLTIAFILLILCFILYIFSINQNIYKESFIYKFIKYILSW